MVALDLSECDATQLAWLVAVGAYRFIPGLTADAILSRHCQLRDQAVLDGAPPPDHLPANFWADFCEEYCNDPSKPNSLEEEEEIERQNAEVGWLFRSQLWIGINPSALNVLKPTCPRVWSGPTPKPRTGLPINPPPVLYKLDQTSILMTPLNLLSSFSPVTQESGTNNTVAPWSSAPALWGRHSSRLNHASESLNSEV